MNHDLNLLRLKFERSTPTYDAHAFAQKRVAERLATMVSGMLPDDCPRRVLEIGCGTGLLTRLLDARLRTGVYFLNDLNTRIETLLQSNPLRNEYRFLPGDAQQIDLPRNIDLAVSASTLQWFSDLPAFFRRIGQALAPGGYFLFSTFGPDNLREIAVLTRQGLAYPGAVQIEAWLDEEFERLASGEEAIKLTFDEPMDVLRHLKHTGVCGGFSSVWSKGRLKTFCDDYRARFSVPGGVSLTYHPVYFAARMPRLRKTAS